MSWDSCDLLPNPILSMACKKRNEQFVDGYESSNSGSSTGNIKNLIYYLLSIFAIYKAFQCTGGELGHLLVAFCCSPCYLAYVYGALGGCAG